MRGSRWVPPSISGTRAAPVKPRRSSAATRRSHHSASSRPPARHQPEIAAIVGFEEVAGEAQRAGGIVQARPSVSISLRSAPAQKATPPAPVRTSTRAESSASKRS